MGRVGELVGAVGVVLSLVYLAIQIRQNTRQMEYNTRATQAAAYQEALGLSSSVNMQIVRDPEVARLAFLSPQEVDALDEVAERRWVVFVVTSLRSHQSFYHQYRQGLIAEELWRSHDAALRNFLSAPAIRSCWESRAADFSDSFREHVSRHL